LPFLAETAFKSRTMLVFGVITDASASKIQPQV